MFHLFSSHLNDVTNQVTRTPLGMVMMYMAGIISGLLGIGSGTFKVLAMDTAMRLPVKVSTTTSNFMIGVTAAASAGIYFSRGEVPPLLAPTCSLSIPLEIAALPPIAPHTPGLEAFEASPELLQSQRAPLPERLPRLQLVEPHPACLAR